MNKAHDYPELTLDRSDPLKTVSKFIEWEFTIWDTRALHHHQGRFWAFNGVSYRELGAQDVRKRVYAFLRHAKVPTRIKGFAEQPHERFQPTRHDVDNVIDALRAEAHLSDRDTHEPPFWVDSESDYPPLDELILCKNGMLHIASKALFPATPLLFATRSLPVACDPEIPEPTKWMWFMKELWGADQSSIKAMQEWVGYLLTSDTTLQKIMLVVGPKRSGKGTIIKVIKALLGKGGYAGPTLASLSERFGLAPLIGKAVAVISDARLNKQNTSEIAERLLNISGEDTVTIDRKNQPAWTGQLSTRFMVMTNELPAIADTSGALASRFIVLKLVKSFYGHEDTKLFSKLKKELPGILNWALDGLYRLREREKFIQPASSKDTIRQLEELGSPITAFIDQCCHTGVNHSVSKVDLFKSWKDWCIANGHEVGDASSFGRDLHAVIPGLGTSHPRIDNTRVWVYQGIGLIPVPDALPIQGKNGTI